MAELSLPPLYHASTRTMDVCSDSMSPTPLSADLSCIPFPFVTWSFATFVSACTLLYWLSWCGGEKGMAPFLPVPCCDRHAPLDSTPGGRHRLPVVATWLLLWKDWDAFLGGDWIWLSSLCLSASDVQFRECMLTSHLYLLLPTFRFPLINEDLKLTFSDSLIVTCLLEQFSEERLCFVSFKNSLTYTALPFSILI